MSSGAPDLLLRLDAVPSSIAVARQALAGACDAAGLNGRAGDVKIAVTEACTNAVIHAYPPEIGEASIEVAAARVAEGLLVTVRDHGIGMGRPSQARGLGVGLSLMAALADRLELERPDSGQGTEVRMVFATGASA